MQLMDHSKLLQVGTLKYAFFDGDNVGNTIGNLLGNGRIAEATHLSESIKLSIFQIELFVKSVENAEIIIAGGDDVLIRYDSQKCNSELLENISSLFTKQTGLSMSCGVGDNVSQAIDNLTKVKQKNKGTIRSSTDASEAHNHVMKQTKLYIFTTSEVPDPYINVVAHCAANYENLNQITLIGITGDRRKVSLERDKLGKLKQNIDNQLDSLTRGKYLKKKGKEWEELEIDIDIEPVDCQTYSRLKDFPFNVQVLIYQDLEEEIQRFLNTEDSVLHIFDVTAVLKSYLVDIYTILRFRNVSTIHSFELFNERSYDHKDLIHNQTYKKTYDFTCLSESSYTRDKIVVSEDSIISESDFNHIRSDLRILQSNYDQLEDILATDFARLCSLVYFLVLIPVFLWICWSIAQPEGWNRVEPLAFVVTFGWFLLNYLLQSLFTGRFPAFDPRELFNASKTWRKKKLQKSRLNIQKTGI
jgi:minimal CRISPR polymerase domain